jgi:hypothetical protein
MGKKSVELKAGEEQERLLQAFIDGRISRQDYEAMRKGARDLDANRLARLKLTFLAAKSGLNALDVTPEAPKLTDGK